MPKIQSADVKALVEELEAAAERFGLTYTPSDDLEETITRAARERGVGKDVIMNEIKTNFFKSMSEPLPDEEETEHPKLN